MKRKTERPQGSDFPKRYQTPPELGLTTTQVKERTAAGLVNTVTEKASKSAGQIVRSQIFTYFNFIFFLLAAVLIYEGSYNNLTFLGVVFANTIIGIVQGLRSKRVLDRLQLVAAPDSTAVRDGREVHIPSEELVLDDIVLLTAGNQICADGVVCTGELTVNESLVTGEADEIKKRPGDHLLSGSFVVSGRAYIRLDQVGDSSFAAKLSKGAKQIKKKQQPGMMRSLTRLIQVIGVIIIPFAAMMFHNQHHILGMSEKVSVENTAAAIIGMIPEGLYLLTSIALMASTIRLARKDTLVHDMKCIETLARVDTICVDKTGTITQPQMEVGEIIPLSGVSTSDIDRHLSSFVHGMDNDNETMRALKAHFEGKKALHHPVRILGFSSKTKFSAADFGGGNAYLLGAPEFLLKHMDSNKLTFSMMYYYNERYLLPLSHDEVVHGKATILQKMSGGYEQKFPQAKALYLYMMAHPGKKLNFMGNEIGHFREWDENRELDWNLLQYPKHDAFFRFITDLNRLYAASPALWQRDYRRDGFRWLDCHQEGRCIYAFERICETQRLVFLFNFSGRTQEDYLLNVEGCQKLRPLICSEWEEYGGTQKADKSMLTTVDGPIMVTLAPFSGLCLSAEHANG